MDELLADGEAEVRLAALLQLAHLGEHLVQLLTLLCHAPGSGGCGAVWCGVHSCTIASLSLLS